MGRWAKGVAMLRDRRYPSDLTDAQWALIEPRLAGLVVLRVRWVDSETPIRARGSARRGFLALAAFPAGRVSVRWA
jgi:hypothetical protein